MWSQILPFISYNVQHNSSHNFSYSPNCNGWHHLFLSREMAEEQLRAWSYQPDLSLFLICTHAVVTCALHMLRLHGWMLMLYQAVDDFAAGSAPWAVGAALVHFWKANYSQVAGVVILQPDLSHPNYRDSLVPRHSLPLCLCCRKHLWEYTAKVKDFGKQLFFIAQLKGKIWRLPLLLTEEEGWGWKMRSDCSQAK